MDKEASSQAALDVAVIGAGRMGRHHARTYCQIARARLVGIVDVDEDRAATLADDYGCAAFTSVDALLAEHGSLRAVTIAAPTRRHVEAAEPLLERGVACLVEKPLAMTVDEARRLTELAAAKGVVLAVGHTERFNPAVRAVAAMGVTPRFIEVDRVSPMTFRSMDVGVVMDMMIHDLDIVLSLVRSPILKVDAVGVSVLSDKEDIASARLVFESGCVTNLTASRLALKTERKMRLFSEQAYVSLDYQRRSGILVRKSENDRAISDLRSQLAEGADLSDVDYSSLVNVEELEMDASPETGDPLTAEQSDFLEAVASGGTPAVTAEAGTAAIAAAEAVVTAIREHRWEGLDPSNPLVAAARQAGAN
ncbi:MAG: Gfo/Idh/MocA family protein [Phycisphaeraceae bacterium]